MERYIKDEKTGIDYELIGDYYIPCLTVPSGSGIGVWGRRHRNWLRNAKPVVFSGLLLSGKLNDYLVDIDKQAEDMFSRLVKELADKDGITETLKAENQMEWVRRMNAVRATVKEIVNHDLIFA